MSSNYLSPRLLRAAQLFSSVVKAHNGQAVLIGGAAVMLQGHNRSTKDLDFNIEKAPGKKMTKHLADVGIILRKHPERKDMFSATVEETSPGQRDGASIDLAVRPDVPRVIEAYGTQVAGITIPKRQYLLVQKMRTVCERPFSAQVRIKQDMDDIYFLCGEIAVEDGRVEEELRRKITPEVWEAFWKIAENNMWWDTKMVAEVREMLQGMGITGENS